MPAGISIASQLSNQASAGIKKSQGLGATLGGWKSGIADIGLTQILSTITGNPLLGALVASAGTELLGGLFGNKQSPYERNLATLIANLQKQAGGMPTPATKMQGNLLNREVNRAMQSTAASATRAMPSGKQYGQTAPARVAQNRLQGARIEGLANIMGQSSINAQNQLAQAYGMQGELEAQEAKSKANVSSMIAQLIGSFAEPQLSKDPFTRSLQESILSIMDMVKGTNQKMWSGQYTPTALANTGNAVTSKGITRAPEREPTY